MTVTLVLSSCTFLNFFVEDEERAAVNYEIGGSKSGGGGGAGWVTIGRKAFIRRKISSLPLLEMENAMNPLCNATLPVARNVYRS